MGKRPKRKVILFLVEGRSDREALQLAISEFYEQMDENIEIFFPIIREGSEEKGGDITSACWKNRLGKYIYVKPHNIEDAIYENFLLDFFKVRKLYPKDISEIVQIVDMDGVYIPDENVCQGPGFAKGDHVFYGEEEIQCFDVDSIQDRNKRKRNNLDFLSSLSTIKVQQKEVPYSLYYFSCNLDHFLHHCSNLEARDKINLANVYANNYLDNPKGFAMDVSRDPGAAKDMTYEESWEFIKEGTNSLHRHTNLNLLLESLL